MSKNKFHDINYYLKKYPTQNGFQIPNIIDDLHIGTNLREAIDNTPIGHQESKDYQVAKALEILSCCNPNHEAKDFKRVGLVVGKVQSGKTTNFSLLSAAAADHGYNLIVHLLGTENLLKDENLRDVKDILGIKHSSTGNWRLNEMKSKSAGKGRKIGLTPKNLHSLLKKGQPAIFMEQDEKVIYIPMLKNHSHIEDLAVLFEKAQLKHHKDVLTLIIDDEVDSASINIAKPDQLPSSTNSKLKRLFDAAGRCTYVGYTATSAAVKLRHLELVKLYV